MSFKKRVYYASRQNVLTVHGLIEELKKYPQEMPVFVYGGCVHDGGFATSVDCDGSSVDIFEEADK